MFIIVYLSGTGEYMTTEADTREQAETVRNFDGTPASVYTREEYENDPDAWV